MNFTKGIFVWVLRTWDIVTAQLLNCAFHVTYLVTWDVLLQTHDGKTPLHMTAVNGRFTRAQTLINNGITLPPRSIVYSTLPTGHGKLE